jgi:pyrroloquinoline-quinone synthase
MDMMTNDLENQPPLSHDELEARLRAVGAERYHDKHPFHKMLHSGGCTRGQVQAWALNRYYYQASIPVKDGALIGRCHDHALRTEWRHRLEDHDGPDAGPDLGVAGIARWLKLTDALGLDRDDVVSTRLLLPATRYAVDAYITFVKERTLLEAVASSLTELFSPKIITERIAGMLANYDYVTPEVMGYFDKRPPQAARDSSYALNYAKQNARTRVQQQQVIDALVFKCDLLWAMLDALHYSYVTPGLIPPGAFRPADHG